MIKEDVLQYLKDSGYLLSVDGKTIITNKFLRELGISPTPAILATRQPTKKLVEATKEDYKQFIINAEVPTMITTSNGKFFANRFSEKGFNAFKKVISENDPKVLLAACKWYYKQTSTARVMIGNWFSEGIWVSCYDDMKKAIENRDKKTTKINSGKDYGNVLPTFLEEGSSNMEQG